jgi:arsenite methyltransferase
MKDSNQSCCAPSYCKPSSDLKETQEVVREKYGELAKQVSQGGGCCGGSASEALGADVICGELYDEAERSQLPVEAVLASLGCGNPTALAQLELGETVLDLGSGGGIDVLLSARRVGPTGKAYGLDMTDDMLALARQNQAKSGLTNVEFLRGEIENIPLPNDSVDVIISNCVINLSGDKDKVLSEALRVLKPGGRFAVSDIVSRGDVPDALKRNIELWIGCVAGALHEDEYQARLKQAGFVDISIEPTRVYRAEDARELLQSLGGVDESILEQVDGKFYAGFVRASKPL